MSKTQTTPQEVGLELVKVLMGGKMPCKHSDALWEVAIKLLGLPWTIVADPKLFQFPVPNNNSCLMCGRDHGGLQCPNLAAH